MKKSILKSFTNGVRQHAPLILAVGGLVAAGATVIFAVKEAPKVKLAMEDKKTEKAEKIREKLPEDKKDEPIEVKLSVVDKVKVITKHCWPAIIAAISCIASTVVSQWMCGRRIAAAQLAKDMTQKAFDSYVDETIKKFGAKKEDEIRENVLKKAVENEPVAKDVVITGKGDVLCKKTWSTVDKIRKAENLVNAQLLEGEFVSVNEFYDELGVSHITLGDNIGFDIGLDRIPKDSFMKIVFTPQLNNEDQMVLGISYDCIDRYSRKKIEAVDAVDIEEDGV